MKFVYVVISDESDFFAEQAIISAYSLLQYNPGADIVFLMDDKTLREKKNVLKYLDYIDIITIDNLPSNFNNTQKSRFIKTAIPRWISGDFLYIDCDTIISGDLNNLKNIKCEIAARRITPSKLIKDKSIPSQLYYYFIRTGNDADENKELTQFFNGGVILYKDSSYSKKFFEKWHSEWLKDSTEFNFHKDQPAMWRANKQCRELISDLNIIYNCLSIKPRECLPFLSECKIFHYYSSSKRSGHIIFKDPEFLKKFRKEGFTPEIIEQINNFRENYIKGIRFLMDDELENMRMPVVNFALILAHKFPVLNKIVKKIGDIFHLDL